MLKRHSLTRAGAWRHWGGGVLAVCCAVLFTAAAARAAEKTWAEKMFDRLDQDFGTVPKGSVAKARIKITSLWRDDTHIADVRTTCGCSAAKPEKTTLKSNESTYIEITMNTHKFTHRKNSNVIVTFDKPQKAEVRIPITAYIQPDIILNPGSVNFGAVDNGTAWRQKVQISHARYPNWTVKSAHTDSEYLDVTVTPSADGKPGYELAVLLKPSAPIGDFRDQVVLETAGGYSPPVTVLVEGKVDPDVIVSPQTASIGTLTPGEEKTVRVVVRGKRAITIEKITSEASESAFAWQSPTDEKNVHVIPIRIKADADMGMGKIVEEFDVRIAGRAEPVKFKVYGEIAAAH